MAYEFDTDFDFDEFNRKEEIKALAKEIFVSAMAGGENLNLLSKEELREMLGVAADLSFEMAEVFNEKAEEY